MLLVAAARLLTLPHGFWEEEELRFAAALRTFDPAHGDPEAPGYPVYVALGRLVNVFARDPFVSLVALSVIASIACAYFVARFANPGAALVLLLSPAMLIFGPLPNAESTALALIAAMFFFLDRRMPASFGAAAAAAIGCKPQLAPAVLAVVLIAVFVLPRRRMLIAFAVGVALFALDVRPFAFAPGPSVMRYLAHPWGTKFLSFPLLLLAFAGAVLALRKRRPLHVALAAFAIVHFAVAFLFLGATDGVQPVLPALLPVAVFASLAIARWPLAPLALSLAYAAGSVLYVLPVLQARRAPSPPAAAAASIPRDAVVVLFDPPLTAHARAAGLRAFSIHRFGDFAATPARLFVLTEGRGERTFEWPDSDPYGKITTERFRVASATEVPPARRFRPRAGVYQLERTPAGEEWRWLAKDAVLDLPPVGATVTLRLALPPESPLERNVVRVGDRSAEVARGASAELTVPYAPRLVIRSERSFQAPGDPRDLAVQLRSVEQR